MISTLVAEVYGSIGQPYGALVRAALRVRGIMEEVPGVVDVDDVLVAPQSKTAFRVDRIKAALHGIGAHHIVQALEGAVSGALPSSLRLEDEVHPVRIRLRLPQDERELEAHLGQLFVRGTSGEGVYLSELGSFEEERIDQPVYHKNLRPEVYVFGETAGLPPPDAVLTLSRKVREDPALNLFISTGSGRGS